jgi:hypothetical protein
VVEPIMVTSAGFVPRRFGWILILALILPDFTLLRAQAAQSAPAPPAPGEESAEPPPPAETAPEGFGTEPAAEKTAGAELRGRILGPDRKTGIAGGKVLLIPRGGEPLASSPSDAKGRYSLSGIPPGTYRLAVSTGDGAFVMENELGITSSHAFTIDLATIPAEGAAGTIPGLDAVPRGFAYMVQGQRAGGGGSFWRSPKGIILLAVSAGAVALILSHSGSNDHEEKPVSPSAP